MNRTSKWMIMTAFCIMLAGCGNDAERNEDTQISQTESSVPEIVESEAIWTEDMKKEEIRFLEENFAEDMSFRDMDAKTAENYGTELVDAYDFVGRVTEDGYGYVLAFRKEDHDIFEGYDQYWKDHDFVISETDENGKEYIIYSLTHINNLYQSENNEILYIQPDDLEEPENLEKAFVYKYCSGEEGIQYLEDAIERNVRFTAPEDSGYLAVYRYEEGKQYLEYILLSEEEEKRILNSDALIMPEWYGNYGLQYFVSQEVYEETGIEQGPITEEALEIAEARCKFAAMGISEVHDIVKAKMRMRVVHEDGKMETISEELVKKEEIEELENIISSSEISEEGKCPYDGILTLTREDGKEIVLSMATDSCTGFILGSNAVYTAGNNETERIWELFPAIRKHTGWALEE